MGKKWIIIMFVAGIILAIILGIYAFSSRDEISDTNVISTKELAELNEVYNIVKEENNDEVIATSLTNTSISPNAIIIEKRYYKVCDHLIKKVVDVPESLVNKTEANIKEEYLDWKLEGFSPTEIVVYKEYNEYCDEHYMIREKDGKICIYTVNQEGVETLKEETEISIMYLPEQDLIDLKSGINIVGKTNLYAFLEDYE